MNDKDLYLQLCDELDDILIKSGIRDLCIQCHTKRKENIIDHLDHSFCIQGGCCLHKCQHLTPKGCNSKVLCCKLWFCTQNQRIFIEKLKKINKLDRYHEILQIAINKKFLACSADWKEIKGFRKTRWYDAKVDKVNRKIYMHSPCKILDKVKYRDHWQLWILPKE